MINGNYTGNGGDGCEGVGDDHDGDYPGIVLSIVLRLQFLRELQQLSWRSLTLSVPRQ